MDMEQFQRTALLYGEEAVLSLQKKRVCVFGIGGVGGHTTEALVRSGIGAIDIVDNDCVVASNLNRQIVATTDTIGRLKTDVMEERIRNLNSNCRVYKHTCFYLPQTAEEFDFSLYDYVVDAVDTVTAKIDIILRAKQANVPVISAMGAGNKYEAQRMEVADIYETSVCPLAKVMRRELKKRGVESLKVVYSKEEPKKGDGSTPGSNAFVPAVAGLIMAGEIINDFCLTGDRI